MENNLTSALKKESYDLIDFLPSPVEKGKGHYFKVEKYFHKHKDLIYAQYADFFLKLYCYFDLNVEYKDKEYANPSCKKLVKLVERCAKEEHLLQVYANTADFVLSGDDLYMTVYGLDDSMRSLVDELAKSSGLFLRQRTL